MEDLSRSSPAELFIAEIRTEFPGFRIIAKAQSPLSRLIDVVLRIVTFGGQDRFITHYHTVIGYTLYVPASWATLGDTDRCILLRHERVHLRQRKRYGFLGMAFIYLVPLFPLGLAYGRARLEWEAYVETLRATSEYYGASAMKAAPLRESIVGRFTGPDYGWMWPFRSSVERWYDEAVRSIEADRSVT